MKVAIVLLLVAVVAGGILGSLFATDPGYVLVAYDDMAWESSIWFAVFVLLLIYVGVRLTMYLITRLGRGGGQVSRWNQKRKERGARNQTVKGLLLMAEGRWADARKLLVGAAPRAETPLINYLNAARASHELGDETERDEFLRQAHETTPGSRFAVGLTQAQLQLNKNQWEQCIASLLPLAKESPRHPLVTSMLLECFEAVGDWDALLDALGGAAKAKVVDADERARLARAAWIGKLEADPSPKVWRAVPSELRKDPQVVLVQANALLAQGDTEAAEAAVRGALSQRWDTALVTLYGQITSPDPERQMAAATGWLKERPNDAELLLTLGRVSLMNGEWNKAREYFEASLNAKSSAAVYGELGRLCTAMGDAGRGSEYLAQSLDWLPSLPLPERGA